MEHEDLQQAVRDIGLIRRAIEKADGERTSRSGEKRSGLTAQLCVHGAILILGIAALFTEYTTNQTGALLASAGNSDFARLGVLNAILLLVLTVLGVYGIITRSAKGASVSVDDFIRDHFSYLKNFSFVSDLGVKFAIFSLVVLAQVPSLVAPLLTIYIADFLFQGRVFAISYRIAALGGVACLLVAGIQFARADATLIIPLEVFVGVAALSMLTVLQQRISTDSANA